MTTKKTTKKKPATRKKRVTKKKPTVDKLNTDGWNNVYTGVGSESRDKSEGWFISKARTLSEQELTELYRSDDLAQRICKLPAVEMMRQGFHVRLEDDNEGDTSKALFEQLEALQFKTKVIRALTMARLYGTCFLFIGADDGRDPSLPLDLSRLRSIRFISLLDRHEMDIVEWEDDVFSPTFGLPSVYQLSTDSEENTGRMIHASRLLRFDGTHTPRRTRRDNSYWADSVFIRLYDVLKAYNGTWKTVEALMQDFAQGVFKMRNLAEIMAANNENEVIKRLSIMDTSRSMMRSIILDADMEDFERKATPIAGLPDVLQRWMARMSAAAEMPQTLLFGISPGGIANDGNSEAENWSNAVKSMQEEFLRPQLEQFLTILLSSQDGPTGGSLPESWSFEFADIRQLNMLDEAKRRKTIAETDRIYWEIGATLPHEIAMSRFGGFGYDIETKIDKESREALAELEMEGALVKAEMSSELQEMETNQAGSQNEENQSSEE